MPVNSGGSSTSQISFSTIRDYHGDSNPVSLGDYYRGSTYIKNPSSDAGSTESNYNSSVATSGNPITLGSLNQTFKRVTPTCSVQSTTGSTSLSPRAWVGEHNGSNWQSGRYSINYNQTSDTNCLLFGSVWNGTILLTFRVNTSGFYYFQGTGGGDGTHQHRFQLYGSGLASSDVDVYLTTSGGSTALQRVQLTANTDITAKGFMPSGQTYNWHASTIKLFVNDDTNGTGQYMWI
jgi:hypothetical protein